jgi:hypothetical protein
MIGLTSLAFPCLDHALYLSPIANAFEGGRVSAMSDMRGVGTEFPHSEIDRTLPACGGDTILVRAEDAIAFQGCLKRTPDLGPPVKV